MMQDDDGEAAGPSGRAKGEDAREARLAEALRANLRKRKAQARARRQRGGEPPAHDD